MHRTKLFGTTAAVLIAVSATAAAGAPAYADCGDPGQSPCTGPVPTPDQVLAVMAELTNPDISAANKADVVAPGFSPEQASKIDDHLNRMNGRGLLPLNFVVFDIQSAPANFAGATVVSQGGFYKQSRNEPIVLVDRGGHWLITNDTAMTALDNFWLNADRSYSVNPWVGR